MSRKILHTLLLAGVLALAMPALAQPCQSDVPDSMYVGDSYCLQVCPFQVYVFWLVGPIEGSGGVPVLSLRPGCNYPPVCAVPNCTPIPVPPVIDSLEIVGADTFYYGDSDCIIIRIHHDHHGYWVIDIFSLCQGCFCLSFDRQLPVELQSFRAVAGDNEVTLNWATASENNNDRFIVARDGEDVASLRSQGNGPAGHSYSWTDVGVTNGRTYTYVLSAVDIGGSRDVLATTKATPMYTSPGTVTEYALAQNYPNPFNPVTRISFDLPEAGEILLKVFNPIGSEVATLVSGYVNAGRHAVDFDGSSLTSGLYFYSIQVGDKFSATRKMLLVK